MNRVLLSQPCRSFSGAVLGKPLAINKVEHLAPYDSQRPRIMKVTISRNPRVLPAPPVHLEGRPSPLERQEEQAEAEQRRRVWRPGPEAFDLLDRLRDFVGSEVVIQGWDSIMLWLDDEGPYPVIGRCAEVLTRTGPTGHTRAYVALRDPTERPTPHGSSGLAQLVQDGHRGLLGFHKMFSIATREW